MGEQTATDRLRAKLDELGIAWFAVAETATEYEQEGIVYRAYEFCDGLQVVIVTPVAPEQAIAATLGRGTCHDAAGKQMAFFACSACGATNEHKHPMFCYGCGREVVDE